MFGGIWQNTGSHIYHVLIMSHNSTDTNLPVATCWREKPQSTSQCQRQSTSGWTREDKPLCNSAMAGPGRCSEPYKQLLLPPSYHIYGVSVTPSQDMKLDLQTLKTKDPWKLFCFVGAQLISLYIIKHLQHYDSYLHSRWSEPSIITRHIPLLYLVEVHQKNKQHWTLVTETRNQ